MANPLALAVAQIAPPPGTQQQPLAPATVPPLVVVATPAPEPVAQAPVPAEAPRHHVHAKGDPWEGFNRRMFKLQQGLDKAFFRPAAIVYKTVVPKPVRKGFRHILTNLTEPVVFLNDLLQLRPGRAAKTFARFLINTTAGLGGLLDLAKGDGLPHRDNGFGNTLARYGVGPGPYLFLPFLGPGTLRDTIAGQADDFVLPLAIGDPFDRLEFQIPRGIVDGLDLRVENDVPLRMITESSADPYASLRSVYLQNRAAEVAEVKGTPAEKSPLLEDPLTDPAMGSDATVTPAPEGAASDAAQPAPPETPAEPSPKPETAPPPQAEDGFLLYYA